MLASRFLVMTSGLAALAGLSACGVGPGPDLAGPQGPTLMAAYSGDWVLLRPESDDLDTRLREALLARPGDAPGGMPGGGGMAGGRGGGRPPGSGGMTGSRGGMPGGEPGGGRARDPEEMRRIMRTTQLISRTRTEFSLTLRPEAASVQSTGHPTMSLPLSGEEQGVREDQPQAGDLVEYFATAEWTEDGLEVEQRVNGGGRVEDKIHVDEGGRLVIEREIDTGRQGKVKGTLVYVRKEG